MFDGLERADALLVARGLAESRTRARAAIEAGRVFCDGQPVLKPAQRLHGDAALAVTPDAEERYVSRGGLKLAAALEHCALDVRGAVCLDVGQSTGGFSDCLLQAGARAVVGVEVGHGQLHSRLVGRDDCIALEGINARHLDAAALGTHFPHAGFDLIVCDASFISLTLLLPRWPALLAADGDIVALVKPQFELGPQALGKGGVVRDERHYATVETRMRDAAHAAGLDVLAWLDSPISGKGVGHIAGNREFFIRLRHARGADTPY